MPGRTIRCKKMTVAEERPRFFFGQALSTRLVDVFRAAGGHGRIGNSGHHCFSHDSWIEYDWVNDKFEIADLGAP